MTHNDITGDPLKSKTGNQDAYSVGYDMIFGKKSTEKTEQLECQKSPSSINPLSSASRPE